MDKGVGCTDPEHFCSGADPSECHEQTSARQATPQVSGGEEMGLGSSHILPGGSKYLQTEGTCFKNHILLLYRRSNA